MKCYRSENDGIFYAADSFEVVEKEGYPVLSRHNFFLLSVHYLCNIT